MFVCKSCGALVQESLFCSECGSSLANASSVVADDIRSERKSESGASSIPLQGDQSSELYSGEVPSLVGNNALNRPNNEAFPDPANQIVFAVTLLIVEIICCCCGGGIAAIFSGIALYLARQVENTTDREKATETLDKAKIFNIVSLVIFVFCLLAAIAAMVVGVLLN